MRMKEELQDALYENRAPVESKVETQTLAHLDRGCRMIEAECEKVHMSPTQKRGQGILYRRQTMRQPEP